MIPLEKLPMKPHGALHMAIVVFLAATPAAAQNIRLFITASPSKSEFVEPETKARMDSARDVRAWFEDPRSSNLKGIVLVATAEGADVILEVTGRQVVETDRTSTSGFVNKGGGFSATTAPVPAGHVLALLRAGDYQRELTATKGLWSKAGAELGKQVRDWIRANQQQLLSRRQR